MRHIDTFTWLLIVFAVLTIVVIANCEPLLSMYQAPSDKNKTVIECSFEDGRQDQRLLIKNSELDSDKITKWYVNICLGKPNE